MKRFLKTLLILSLLAFSACKEQIVHNLSELEANKFLTRLEDAHIEASKERQNDGMFSISVSKSDEVRAIRYLREARVYRETGQGDNAERSLVASRDEERFQLERALSHEIEKTLLSLEGVLDARVHLHTPPVDPLLGKPLITDSPGSASVVLIAQEAFLLPKEDVAQIVAGASGIKKEQVAVILTHALGNTFKAMAPLPEDMAVSTANFKAAEPTLGGIETLHTTVKTFLKGSGIIESGIGICAGAGLLFLGLGLIIRVKKQGSVEAKQR